MVLTVNDIAQMFDLSCVRTNSDEKDIKDLAENARRYNCGHVSVMQCFIPVIKKLLSDRPDIKVVGNVSFPSGSDTTSVKVFQAVELRYAGCDEIDMVINVGKLRSGRYAEVEDDVKAVVEAADRLPVKAIIEVSCLDRKEVEKACEISIKAGAAFIKTGTGWMPGGTTIEDIKLIKSIVGDRIRIKASGGIRTLDTLLEMYSLGVTRFGVNMCSGIAILDECIARGGEVTI
ncbi:MAG TPA: deoxyribose-phosphate aldolase [Clostridiales bacterium]|nr:deoxyribose-phosphate aldolase [Clostridiales bacterium]HPP35937.1 deoxyribose-phosphate aldolase [Clostridiales bacterium]